jgi:hypothetical protein
MLLKLEMETKVMDCDINIVNIIEWIIAIFLGVTGWYIAIRSTLFQQKKERYNDLVHDFHQFIYDFRFNFLREIIVNNNDFSILNINRQIKFIYYKTKDIDSLTKSKEKKIYEKIKNAGEIFIDSTLLVIEIENSLISKKKNKQIEAQKKIFLQFADRFVETCYSVTGFSI